MGGVRRLILAFAILVATAAAMPARAVDVVGTSARLRWAPASGPVAAYAVWMIRPNGPPPSTPSMASLTNAVTVSGAIGDTFQVQVAALDAHGIMGPRSPLSVPIRFVAAPGPGSAPLLVLSAQSVSLSARRGSAAAPVRIQISNGGGGSLSWTARGFASWLVLGPATAGSAPGSLEIGASSWGLKPGAYHATVSVSPSGSGTLPQTIEVTLLVGERSHNYNIRRGAAQPSPSTSPPPATSASVAQLQVSTLGLSVAATGGKTPPAQSFTVRNAGGGTLRYQIAPQASWLAVSPASGSSQGEADPIQVGVASAGLAAGTYRSSILVTAPGLPSASVAVTLVIGRSQEHPSAQPYDLDGDGHADLLSRDASGVYQVTLLGDGGPIAQTPLATAPPAGATLLGSGDLDGDGKADLVWSDPGGGALELWLMNGAAPSATRTVALGGRSLLAVADFDGDGKADLLLDAGGALELWRMNGLQTAAITSGITGLGSAHVVGTVDLDQDGRASLVLASADPSGSRYAVASLAGTQLVPRFALPTPAPNLVFVTSGPCGAAGAAGILWRNPLTGQLALWSLGRGRIVGQENLDLTLPAGWQLAATGDFSGDGRTDLLLRNGSGGALVVVAFDGPSMVGGFQVADALPAGLQILNR